jgi:hypothetical protein
MPYLNQKAEQHQDENEKIAIKCENCGCSFFEQISIDRYHSEKPTIVGNKFTIINEALSVYALRCAACNEINFPPTATAGNKRLNDISSLLKKTIKSCLEKIRARFAAEKV